MMDGGYIKLYRTLTRWEWYQDHATRALFIHLLLTVNFEDVPWRGIVIRRGQRVASYEKLAEELNLSVKQIRTALARLKRTGEVTSEARCQYSLFTVVRYDRYQSKDGKRADEGQAKGKQKAGEGQQDKKEKKIKNITKKKEKEEGVLKNQKEKIAMAEHVAMTREEYEKLVAVYGAEDTTRMVEVLDNYKGASGKKYASDYRAILSWVAGRVEQEKKRGGSKEKSRGEVAPSGRFDFEACERAALEELKRMHKRAKGDKTQNGGALPFPQKEGGADG